MPVERQRVVGFIPFYHTLRFMGFQLITYEPIYFHVSPPAIFSFLFQSHSGMNMKTYALSIL
jgi:hypothetical protein